MLARKPMSYGGTSLLRFITRRQRSRLVIASALDQRSAQRVMVQPEQAGSEQGQILRDEVS